MKLLVLDGNSIVNRAFYGIKTLSTKDGKFTNGIFGFLNILFSLRETYKPEGVAIAFDVHAPTFRHKMYDAYKGNRKGMPEELAQQMPVLKDLLKALGYTLIECPGWEADDIIGTLSAACKDDDICYIATGDRDSLQLVNEKTKVLLAVPKGGKTETVVYDTEKIIEEVMNCIAVADALEKHGVEYNILTVVTAQSTFECRRICSVYLQG